MITMTMQEILNVTPILQNMINNKFRGADALRITRLVREINNELSNFDNINSSIIEKYAEHDEEGNLIINDEHQYKIAAEHYAAFQEEINALLSETVDLNVEKLKPTIFDDLDITPAELITLERLIEE